MLAAGPASERRQFGGAELVSMHDMAAILGAILRGYALSVRGDHRVVHWARVFENGLGVASATGMAVYDVKYKRMTSLLLYFQGTSESWPKATGKYGLGAVIEWQWGRASPR